MNLWSPHYWALARLWCHTDADARDPNTLLKSEVTRRDHVSVVMDPMNAGSRIVNFIHDGTVFA